MKRIPYGDEKNIYAVAEMCPDCGVRLGQEHVPGCSYEQCPAHHRPLIHCPCSGRSIRSADAYRVMDALVHEMTLEAATQALQGADPKQFSLLHHAATSYMVTVGPKSVQDAFARAMAELADEIGMVPSGDGYKIKDWDKMASYMNCSVDEAKQQIEEIIEAGQLPPGWEDISPHGGVQ